METVPFDPATYLDSEEAIDAYLADARTGDAREIADAAEVVARARKALSRADDHKRSQSA